ncbi:MAG: hypothetical protein NT137_00200 [Methanomassiliicoccales archaeon]|nr:hypothetical protein [Methanomassiliicoccales archaeon]
MRPERSEELRILIGETLGGRIRKRAAQLGVYPGDYARELLIRAVDKDLRRDITAACLLKDGRPSCGKTRPD